MEDDRYSRLLAGDAVATVRSIPRRFREVLATVDDDGDTNGRTDDLGRSVAQIIADTAAAAEVLGRAIERVTISEDPQVALPSGDGNAVGAGSIAEELTSLDDAVALFWQRTQRLHVDDWGRPGHRSDGDTVTAKTLAQHAARICAEDLRTVEDLLRAPA